MSITVAWDNEEHTIVRYDMVGRWNWIELSEALVQANEMMGTVDHMVNVILDMLESAPMPSGNLLVIGKRLMVTMPPDNMGSVVVVSKSAFLQSIANVLTRVYKGVYQEMKYDIAFAKSLEEARTIIAAEKLEPLPPAGDPPPEAGEAEVTAEPETGETEVAAD